MGVELYSQDTIFNASLTAVTPITQLIDPIKDTDVATKYYVDQAVSIIQATPTTLPLASPTVLGGVKIGDGLAIEQSGKLSVVDYVSMRNIGDWVEAYGDSTIVSNTWVRTHSTDVVLQNELDATMAELIGGTPVQSYNTIQKIGNTLTSHADSISATRIAYTWYQGVSSSIEFTNTNTFIGKGNIRTTEGYNNIVIGTNNSNNRYNNCIVLGVNAQPSDNNRLVLGSTANPLHTQAGEPLPEEPIGYLVTEINGVTVKIPYYTYHA